MFAGFNLFIDMSWFKENNIETLNYYKKIGEKHLEDKKVQCNKNLSDYILNGIIDGTSLQNSWFPQIKADIFISHSHKDRDLAVALAGWLNEKFKLHCFIDSCVWGYMDSLLLEINNKYSDKQEKGGGHIVYSHEKCNKAACHVNMMLNVALQKMIDSTEAVFLINTPNSIDKYSEVYDSSTFSPWIYSEITCTQIVRTKELINYREKYKDYIFLNEDYSKVYNELKTEYKVSLEHLSKLESSNLLRWEEKWSKVNNKNNKFPLDELYKITNPKEFKKLINLEERIG